MPYSDELLAEIKRKNDIAALISQYTRLERKSRSNYVGLCPFHSERSPSFSVAADKQLFYCFGCGAGGTVVDFVMRKENLDFLGAILFLAERAKIELPKHSQNPSEASVYEKKRAIYAINSAAAAFFQKTLAEKAGAAAREYLKGRAITEEMAEKFSLGFASCERAALFNHLNNLGFKTDEIEAAGLAARTGGALCDKFRGRLMFPIFDARENIIGFGGRLIESSPNLPKYLNSPETLVFKKGANLFALNFAKKERGEQIILVEGYMDALALYQSGFSRTVACLGTAFTEEQARLIENYASDVLLCFDSDAAGEKATGKAANILLGTSLSVRVVTIPGAKDADEFLKSSGPEAFQKLIDAAAPYVDFKLAKLREKYNARNLDEAAKLAGECADFIARIESGVKREVYGAGIARELGLRPEVFAREIENRRRSARAEIAPNSRQTKVVSAPFSKEERRIFEAERLLLSLLLSRKNFERLSNKLAADDFSESLHKKIAYNIYSAYERDKNYDESSISSAILSQFSEDEAPKVAEIMCESNRYAEENGINPAEPFKIVKENSLKKMLKAAALNGEHEKLRDIMEKLKTITDLKGAC
jgi:DNA primase